MIFLFASVYASAFTLIWLVTYFRIVSYKNVDLQYSCNDFICSSDRGMTFWDTTVRVGHATYGFV